ncbi:hypothetical protein EC968_000484 [Mortierella alpina]|nr:hypothetical protein EC968_000484 [Mortierella alpina]
MLEFKDTLIDAIATLYFVDQSPENEAVLLKTIEHAAKMPLNKSRYESMTIPDGEPKDAAPAFEEKTSEEQDVTLIGKLHRTVFDAAELNKCSGTIMTAQERRARIWAWFNRASELADVSDCSFGHQLDAASQRSPALECSDGGLVDRQAQQLQTLFANGGKLTHLVKFIRSYLLRKPLTDILTTYQLGTPVVHANER